MTDDRSTERYALERQDRMETMTDKEILEAYEATDGQQGDQWTDLLVAALKERSIDV